MTLGQGQGKVIQYISPDPYILWLEARMPADAAVGTEETNWKHKVTPNQGDLIKNHTTVSIYSACITFLTKYIPYQTCHEKTWRIWVIMLGTWSESSPHTTPTPTPPPNHPKKLSTFLYISPCKAVSILPVTHLYAGICEATRTILAVDIHTVCIILLRAAHPIKYAQVILLFW